MAADAGPRIYLSADLEGVAGITHTDELLPSGRDWGRARKLMTAEVNAAIEGAFDAGASRVLVNDSHGDMRNILIEELDARAELISGDLKPFTMVEGVDGGFDGVFYVGYHPGAGTRQGILDHTYYGAVVRELRVNGRAMNEASMNSLVAGVHGVPPALVTGDETACDQCRALLGPVETVTVKWTLHQYCARSLHPEEARRRIRAGAKRAVERLGEMNPFTMDAPYRVEIDMHRTGMADSAARMPGAERTAPCAVAYTNDDLLVAFRGLMTMINLAGLAIPKR